ncbi:MAG: hypothetical protein KME29_31715 [Calothrix sp. FI2-JRJ7]|jgi:hypothetical protein|nr:hypothetical protein [Calothrix sp. FI2-JRJ7]
MLNKVSINIDGYSIWIMLILVFDYAETHAIYVEYSAIVMRRCKAQQGFEPNWQYSYRAWER